MLQNKQVVLAARPDGFPKASDFRVVTTSMRELVAGELMIRVIYLSVDPYMRGLIAGGESYARTVGVGEVMIGGGVGVVIDSRDEHFTVGTYVAGYFGWQEYAIPEVKTLRRVDAKIAPISTALGVLGMTGLTAYFGLFDVGEMKDGESVLISGAAGAVGSIAGQIAKMRNCHVVGIAGTDAKVDYLTRELGFDAAFNYTTATNFTAKIKELCPRGIDVYFDNVGGAITDAAIPLMNLHGRVAVCGQISQYNLERPEMGPRWMSQLIVKRSKVQGFLVSDFAPRFAEALTRLTKWVGEGKLKHREQIAEGGIEAAPKAFIDMLRGGNSGKQLVRVSPD